VKIDDFLLFYLSKYSIPVELYYTQGTEYTLLATSYFFFSIDRCSLNHTHTQNRSIPLKGLLDAAEVSGASRMISVEDNVTFLGSFQYTIHFWKSITEEVKIFKAKETVLQLESAEGSYDRYTPPHRVGCCSEQCF
jgi:hypothetical protein